MSFERLFHPRGVAIIGASSDPTRIGGNPVMGLINAGFKGGIYPVNPKRDVVQGLKSYPNAASIEGPCDMAVIAVPAPMVADAIRDCGKAGIAFVVILTAGFRETKGDGLALEEELKAVLKETGVRAVGPNCQGMISIQERVWAVFGSVAQETGLRPGNVSGAFQSGGFGYAIINLAERQGVGFRYCVSTGNETDITMPEILSEMLDDPGTDIVFGYMEGTPDARKLMDLGRKSLEMSKPILMWKAAQTDIGAKAAASHTANMTGSADLYRAAFRQSGIIEVDDVEPIVDIIKLFNQGRLPKGKNIGALSISGGSGIVFADRADREGLTLPDFHPDTIARLNEIVPNFGSVENPADVTASVLNDISLLTDTLEVVLNDPNIDQLSILLASAGGLVGNRAAEAIVAASAKSDKPIHLAWSARRDKAEEGFAMLEEANVPIVSTPVRLAQAAAVLANFADDRRRLLGREMPAPSDPDGVTLPEGAVTLSEAESKTVLAAFGVPVTKEVLVAEGEDLGAAASGLSYPVAVKVVSRDIAHKTEVGGVKLGIADADALKAAAAEVLANGRSAKPDAKIDGVLVSEMAEGIEVLIGVINDPGFGPTVALGLGGVLTEIMKDITYRVAPFEIETANDMIAELRAAKMFDGYRGQPPADKAALADMLVSVSRMAAGLEPRLAEMDINPVFVGPVGKGVRAADALVVLK